MSWKCPIKRGGELNSFMVSLNGVVTTVLVTVSLALTDIVYSLISELSVGAIVRIPFVKVTKLSEGEVVRSIVRP